MYLDLAKGTLFRTLLGTFSEGVFAVHSEFSAVNKTDIMIKFNFNIKFIPKLKQCNSLFFYSAKSTLFITMANDEPWCCSGEGMENLWQTIAYTQQLPVFTVHQMERSNCCWIKILILIIFFHHWFLMSNKMFPKFQIF